MTATTILPFFRHTLLSLCLLGTLVWLLSLPPIAQPLSYHNFADNNTFFAIPNFLNVISNVPFMLVGMLGLVFCKNSVRLPFKRPWQCFFAGVLLTSVGSAYYHLSPDNASLIWDRLPMTVGFMGLFCALLAEKVHAFFAKAGLCVFILLGVCSVVYWGLYDDLRPYYWVQLAPLLSVVVLLLVYPVTHSHQWLLACALVCYILAKVVEYYDLSIYQGIEVISGHSLKHLFAGLATYLIYQMLRLRTPKAL